MGIDNHAIIPDAGTWSHTLFMFMNRFRAWNDPLWGFSLAALFLLFILIWCLRPPHSSYSRDRRYDMSASRVLRPPSQRRHDE